MGDVSTVSVWIIDGLWPDFLPHFPAPFSFVGYAGQALAALAVPPVAPGRIITRQADDVRLPTGDHSGPAVTDSLSARRPGSR